MNDAALIAIATTIAVFLTEVLSPIVKRKLQKEEKLDDRSATFRSEELNAALQLRKEWQGELTRVREAEREIAQRCDHLEGEVEKLRAENRVLRQILREKGIAIPSPLPLD